MLDRRLMTRTLALALPLAVAAPGFAADPPRDPGEMHRRMGAEMGPIGSPAVHRLMMALHSVELSDDQKGQIHALMGQFHAANEAKLIQLGNAQKAMVDQALAEPIDEAAIRSDVAAMAVVRADVAVAEAYLMKDLRGVLTAEQRDQLEKELAKAPDDMPPPDGAMPRHHGG